ncbi:outer membrane beta-barrel protein [Paraneptunicella aestuarii]|uniref:outer membrane beta-barrel protein n=1 Tax=Paraneptunicella aestuarii TaxID=2831148 RepID=UPI001E6398E5|nr:outer membrane beta-barrel protein [Paraneptunicella aestuarii]UAA37672.1 outer membrane beta-barrel protein [Paraneptunicella aestuarii]
MYKKLPFGSLLLILLSLMSASFTTYAFDFKGFYAVAGAGYIESEVNQVDDDETGFRFGVGYSLHRQWYAEVGFNQLASGYNNYADPTTVQGATNFKSGIDASSIYASLLGKARGEMGELYYRLSVMNLSVKSDSIVAGEQACSAGVASNFAVATGESYTRCKVDDSTVAAGIGLGFDFVLTKNSMIRVEYEHIRGQDDIKLNTASIGFRYNF